MTVFGRAWELLQERIEKKTSWGRQELRNEMFLCLRDAALEKDKEYEEDE